jgi:hypothetical protein
MRQALSSQFQENFAEGRAWTECTHRWWTLACRIDLGRARTISIIDLREDITAGQSVSSYRVEAHGSRRTNRLVLAKGTTIGYRRLHSIAPVRARSFALVIESSSGPPRLRGDARLHNGRRPIGAGRGRLTGNQGVRALETRVSKL